MTPARLLAIMKAKGWTSADLGRVLRCAPDSVRFWLAGERHGHPAPVAPLVAQWLEAVDAGQDVPPPAPEAWKRRIPGKRNPPSVRESGRNDVRPL